MGQSFSAANTDAIVDGVFDLVFIVDRDCKILRANRAFQNAFKLDSEKLTQMHCFDVLDGKQKQCVNDGQSCPLNEVFEKKTAQELSRTYQNGKGGTEHYQIRAVPMLDGAGQVEAAALILDNITQSVRSENMLVEASRDLQRIAEMGDCAILVLTQNNEIEFANPMASELTGYKNKELLRQDFKTLLDDEGLDFWNNHLQSDSPVSGRLIRTILSIKTLSGTGRPCEISINSLPTNDGILKSYVYIRDLSEQLKMENDLRQANEFLSNLIETSVDGIIAADMKGKIIVFNEGAERLLGYKAKEMVGKFNVTNLYPAGGGQEIMRKLRSDDFGGAGRALPHQIIGIHKNGEHIRANLSGTVIYQDGKEYATVGFFYDLRGILKAQAELLESETNFRNLFERVMHGVFFSTREGKFKDCNGALLEMLGYDEKQEFLDMDIVKDLYFEPTVREKFQKMIEADGFVKDYEVKFKSKTGDPVEVLLTAHVRKDNTGAVLGYQGVVVDVTDRKKLEQKLFQSEKLAAMGRLTAQIAHELNNPIFGVMNCLDLIKPEIPEGNKKRKFLDMAYSETQRISYLLKSMLRFFRPDEDEKSKINLNKLVDETLLFMGKQLDEFKVKVTLVFDTALPDVIASGNQLKQVILNMAMNARNAMPNGGALKIATSFTDEFVTLQIADTGVGIPEKNLDRIFDAFFTTKGDVKGVGLGLSVSFGIIRDHGGKIEVESELGKGTTFTISLPNSE